jgi:hypothetical protein
MRVLARRWRPGGGGGVNRSKASTGANVNRERTSRTVFVALTVPTSSKLMRVVQTTTSASRVW